MKLIGLRWVRFRIPFTTEFVTAHGTMRQRDGLLIRLLTDEGTVGLGEAAPLPEFSGGNTGDAERLLRAVAPLLIGSDLDRLPIALDSLLGRRDGSLAVFCALDTAALDAQARAKNVSVATFLDDNAVRSVPVNATISGPSTEEAVTAALHAVEEGFTTIKLKVGMAPTPGTEVSRVGAVREAIGPDIALRLDANGIWLPEQAIGAINELAQFNLEMVEQPVAGEELVGLARVRRNVDVPIAADETVTDLGAARRIIESHAADVLIVKLPIVGGPQVARRIIQTATRADMRVVVTTSFDAGVGVAAALNLAATLPRPVPACGLATGPLLDSDLLVQSPAIHRGHMDLSSDPGLGVQIDDDVLARYAVGPEEQIGW